MPDGLDRTLLASPPLVVTLAQVRFEDRAELAEASVAAALRESMAAHGMTSATQVHVQQVVVEASGAGAGAESTSRTAAGWQFKAPGDAIVVTLLRDQMSLEIKKYPGWDAFSAIWRSCTEGVLSIVKPELVTRLGLRYVNRVRPRVVADAAGWADAGLVDQTFLGPAVGSGLSRFVTGSEGRAALLFGDGVEALVHHGVVHAPEGPEFLLDIDCFSTRADDFSIEALNSRLQELNNHSLEIFQGIVKPELRAQMMGPNGETR